MAGDRPAIPDAGGSLVDSYCQKVNMTMDTLKINPSQCVLCGGRLRNAVFCPACGRSSCSWACSLRHLAEHSRHPARPSTNQSGSRQGDGFVDSMDGRQARP
jgi:hypothetical protein